ncbi:MAG: helix-turn-helix transcriptional regulator [Oscillospiraceae bacterium]
MFTEKLKALRFSRGLNKVQMAKLLNLPYTTYNNYETGTREPNSDVLKLISKEFLVTIDFLLENEKEPIVISDRLVSNKEILDKLNSLPQDDYNTALATLDALINNLSNREK